MALKKGKDISKPSQYRLPASTKQEYISETSGKLAGNHPVILLYIPRGLASEISPIHPYYFRPRGLQSFKP
eukprot:scaffold13153_cov72-Phaeocystis_antarctica.AAC.1